ncbi:MAG: pilus assembly protein TadG-related protein [Pseudomonadales bacterium]
MTNLQRFLKDESGIALIYTVLIMLPILGMAGFAIDSGYVSYLKVRLQNAADAAVLAGANVAPSKTSDMGSVAMDRIIEAAQLFATTNMPTSLYGEALSQADVAFGFWDESGSIKGTPRTFHPMDDAHENDPYDDDDESDGHSHDDLFFNAIKVTTSLINDKNNAPTLNLMSLHGFGSINLEATAIAAITPMPDMQCLEDGFVALGKIKIGDDNIVTGTSACFYASQGITLQSNSCFGSDHDEPDVFFGTPAGATSIQYANNNIVAGTDDCSNGSSVGEPIASAFHTLDIKEVFASPETFIFDLNGTTTPKESITTLFELYLDNKTTAFPSGLNSPDSYNGKQTLGSLDNAIVFVRGDIDFSSGASITNSYIMATGNVSLPSGAQIGRSSHCDEYEDDEDDQTVFIMAAQKIQAAANISAYGAQFISGEDASFTAGDNVGGGLSVISGADIDLTSNWALTGCEHTNQFRKFDEDAVDDTRVSGKSILVF